MTTNRVNSGSMAYENVQQKPIKKPTLPVTKLLDRVTSLGKKIKSNSDSNHNFQFQEGNIKKYVDKIKAGVRNEVKDKEFKYALGKTIASAVVKDSDEIVSEEAVVEQGGYAIVANKLEINGLKYALKSGKFDKEEEEKVQLYLDDLKSSYNINCAIQHTLTEMSEEKMDLVCDQISDQILYQLHSLAEGRSLYINYGHSSHAMGIRIQKQENNFILTLFDSSGGLNRYHILTSLFGIIKLPFYEKKGSSRQTALQIKVTENELYSKGRGYLHDILINNSSIGRSRHREYVEKIDQKIAKWKEKLGPLGSLLRYFVLWTKWNNSIKALL